MTRSLRSLTEPPSDVPWTDEADYAGKADFIGAHGSYLDDPDITDQLMNHAFRSLDFSR